MANSVYALPMNISGLCERCTWTEEDTEVTSKTRPVATVACLFGRQEFPHARQCMQFEPRSEESEDDD